MIKKILSYFSGGVIIITLLVLIIQGVPYIAGIYNTPKVVSASTSDPQSAEVNFLWQVLMLNSVPVSQSPTQATKRLELNRIASQTLQIVNTICHLVSKYSTVLSAQQYNKYSTNCKNNLSTNFSELILLSPSVLTFKTSLIQDIKLALAEKSILTSISFEEFDKFVVLLDEQYSILSEKYFSVSTDTNPLQYNSLLDALITKSATQRGFVLKSLVTTSELETILDGWLLKKGVGDKFIKMQQTARGEGVTFDLISAYRSPEEQKKLFSTELIKYGAIFSRFNDASYINSDEFMEILDKVLSRVAPPGYSRHHTGITVDLYQEGVFDFAASKAFTWLSSNNYYNAKRFGFLPSYPILSEATKYGPNPEAWEYFYVSTDTTYDK